MKAYHNDPAIKEKYLERVRAHKAADEIIKGVYWQNGKGCAVGCTIHNNDHTAYEIELGIPKVLAHLEDRIFENLPNEMAKNWPEDFLESINVGADLSGVWPKFALWLLTDEEFGVLQYADDKCKKVIQQVADCYKNCKEITLEQWVNAYSAAAAASAAASAAYSAAASAAASAAYSAASAAYSAAYSAASAAYSAAASAAYSAAATASAAASAAYSAASAASAAAYSAAAYVGGRDEHLIAQANKLLELLKECK